MNIALVFGTRSEGIKSRMLQLRDDLYIDTYQSITDLIHGSQVRNKVYDRVLILSGVLTESTDVLLNDLYDYWRRFALSSEFVLFANTSKDTDLAKKFNSKMCSPVCTTVLVSNVSVVILEELTSLSIQELSSKYGCEEETNLELEVDSYAEPVIEQPNIIQKPQKKGLLSRIFGSKKKGNAESEASNANTSEVTDSTDEVPVDSTEEQGEVEAVVNEESISDDVITDSQNIPQDAIAEAVSDEDIVTVNDGYNEESINDSDFVENSESLDTAENSESYADDYIDINDALSTEDYVADLSGNQENVSVSNSDEFVEDSTVDNFSELTTPEFSSDDEFNTEESFNVDDFDTTEEFEFVPTISQDDSAEFDDTASSEIVDEEVTIATDNETCSDEGTEFPMGQISEDTSSEDAPIQAEEAIEQQGIQSETDDYVLVDDTVGVATTDTPIADEVVAEDSEDSISNNVFGVPSGDEVSEDFSASDMLIVDTPVEQPEVTEKTEVPTVSEQFSFNMPDAVPVQTDEKKKPQKSKKRGLSSLFNRKTKEKTAEVSGKKSDSAVEHEEQGIPNGDVVYTPVNSEPQHPHVNDLDEAILEENLFGGIDVTELEDAYRKDEQAKNTIVERIEVDKDTNRAFNNVINGKHKVVFLVTGDRGSGVTTFAYALAQEFAKHTKVLYYDGDTDNHGILNYIDLNRFCEYEDIKQQGNKNSRNLSVFKRCVIQYANNFDLLSSLYGTKVSDTEYETVQSVVSDASDDYNVVVADIPFPKLHLCQELVATANVIMMTEPTRRGMMNLACSFDNCELPLKYKRRIAASGILLYSYKVEPNDIKKLKKAISDIIGFDENESNWLNMKTLVRDNINMQFINELLG